MSVKQLEDFLTDKTAMDNAVDIYRNAYDSGDASNKYARASHAKEQLLEAYPVVKTVYLVGSFSYDETLYTQEMHDAARSFMGRLGGSVGGWRGKPRAEKANGKPPHQLVLSPAPAPSNGNGQTKAWADKVEDWFSTYDFAPDIEMLQHFHGLHPASIAPNISVLRRKGFTITHDPQRRVYVCTERPPVVTAVTIDDDEDKIMKFLEARFPNRFKK